MGRRRAGQSFQKRRELAIKFGKQTPTSRHNCSIFKAIETYGELFLKISCVESSRICVVEPPRSSIQSASPRVAKLRVASVIQVFGSVKRLQNRFAINHEYCTPNPPVETTQPSGIPLITLD